MSTATVPLDQHPTAEVRELGLTVINAVMPTFAAGMHAADLAELEREARRLEALESSPVVKTMRRIVDNELTAKKAVR